MSARPSFLSSRSGSSGLSEPGACTWPHGDEEMVSSFRLFDRNETPASFVHQQFIKHVIFTFAFNASMVITFILLCCLLCVAVVQSTFELKPMFFSPTFPLSFPTVVTFYLIQGFQMQEGKIWLI